MKKVIFIAGTSYCGSTYMDMILANDAKGFSAGEVKSLFYPHRPNHYRVIQSIKDNTDHIWHKIYKKGAEQLYRNIFKCYPEKAFIIDSCKSPVWIYQQRKKLEKQGIESKVLLLWKSPEELFKSYLKRSREKAYHDAWLKYHLQFLYFIDDYISVPYKKIKEYPEATLEQICIATGISYFEGKQKFWEKNQETLFGNVSARLKLKPGTFNSANHLKSRVSQNDQRLSNNEVQQAILQFDKRAEKEKEERLIDQIRDKELINNPSYSNQNKNFLGRMKREVKALLFFELLEKKRLVNPFQATKYKMAQGQG